MAEFLKFTDRQRVQPTSCRRNESAMIRFLVCGRVLGKEVLDGAIGSLWKGKLNTIGLFSRETHVRVVQRRDVFSGALL